MKLNTLIGKIDRIARFDEVGAHCDIPCKIYDPSTAQLAALTVLRMVDLIEETERNAGAADERGIGYWNSMVRFVTTKEEHATRCKDEIRIIWGDYFKTSQFERFPEIHDLSHKIMLLASACKQNVDRDKALGLIEAVNRFAEIFWTSKDIAVKRCVCPYPPAVEVVYPDP